ncbi:DUF389 domain-containing protein [Paracoccus sp. p3-h83]|uniref:DUF389 domain-containing protein n=1 Tax=Paracoccus sp. p3-h83 TaxID=3342805 RepID=UPI0035B83513
MSDAQVTSDEDSDDRAAVDADQPDAVIQRRHGLRSRLRVDMRSAALMTPGYLFMNALSAVIASYGLLADSPAVVIGAMIVALLLGPIMGVALAISDGDLKLLRKAGISLLAGGVVVFGVAMAIGWVHLDSPITNEIRSRTAPNLFDLAIALAGGAAGAYATASPRVGAGFVGVAIATALVPPLSASAILVTRGEYDAAGGAFLLAVTNIVAIQFAAAIVLWFNGFARDDDGHVELISFLRRHVVSLLILAGLAFVLAANLTRKLDEETYRRQVRNILSEEMAAMEGNRLDSLEVVTLEDRLLVRANVEGPRDPSISEVAALAKMIPKRKDTMPVDLRVRFTKTRIITPEGIVTDLIEGPLEGPPAPNP